MDADDKFATDLNELFAQIYHRYNNSSEATSICDRVERALALVREHSADIGAPRAHVHGQEIQWAGRMRAIQIGVDVDGLENGRWVCHLRWTPEQIAAFVFPELKEVMRTPFDDLYYMVDIHFELVSHRAVYRYLVVNTVRHLVAQAPKVAAELTFTDGWLSRGNKCICLTTDGRIRGIQDSRSMRTDRDAVDFLLSED